MTFSSPIASTSNAAVANRAALLLNPPNVPSLSSQIEIGPSNSDAAAENHSLLVPIKQRKSLAPRSVTFSRPITSTFGAAEKNCAVLVPKRLM